MTKKVKTIIIDDEKLARKIIKNYLNNFANLEISAECSNGFEGIKEITEKKPDLIFLDIQMPKINGFEMLELIDDPPEIIFTTAFDQFALKAFEVNAVDYLLKPFSEERFKEAVDKALLHLNNKSSSVNKTNKINGLKGANEKREELLERIIIKDGTNISIVPVININYLEAQDDYVMIHSSQGKFLKQKTMKYFEEHLNPYEFVRIHRSFIASVSEINKIELLEKESYQVKMKDGSKLPVSKSGYARLKEILNG